MKRDIETRADIELLIKSFYEKVLRDELIGFVFDSIIKSNWEKHLSVMYDFWENVLFFSGGYTGNPIALHKQIHQHIPLKEEYFSRWLALFDSTVDELFEGEHAKLVKIRASNISSIMQIKIFQKGDFLNKN